MSASRIKKERETEREGPRQADAVMGKLKGEISENPKVKGHRKGI